MFLAMNIAAGEQARGTIRFLQALPVDPSKAAAAKLLAAMLTAVVPVLLTVAAAWLWYNIVASDYGPEPLEFDRASYGSAWLLDDWFASRLVVGSSAAVSILLWMAAGGVNRSDEVRAAAVGLLAMLVVWLVLMGLGAAFRAENSFPTWWRIFQAGAPGGPAAVGASESRTLAELDWATWAARIWPYSLVALLSHSLVAAWFIRRFGRVAPAARTVVEPTSARSETPWLGPPRGRPLWAILWKQARESAPLAALGAVVIVASAIAFALYSAWIEEPYPLGVLGVASVVVWAACGFFVSIVAGIGVFMEDLQSRLHEFWRSRPVNVNQWFLVKFFCGLVITLVILALPPLLFAGTAFVLTPRTELPPNVVQDALTFVKYTLLAQIGVYCAAVLAIVLVRQAAYAAILAIAGVGMFLASLERVTPTDVGRVAWTASLAAALVASVLAWIAVRKDWGWKG
jgi:ABC-type transport system involved in multi-copper enzyme maturation permease subunit